MPSVSADDLFESSRMSFGQHLEELRATLIKCLLALAVGVLIGFFFASWLVAELQTPLKQSLRSFYGERAIEELALDLAAEAGRTTASSKDLATARDIFETDGLRPETVWVPRADLQRRDDAAATPSDEVYRKADMIALRIYRPLDDDPRIRVIGLTVLEAFFIWLKAALVLGLVLSSPLIFYFAWQFVAAGLYPHERSFVYLYLPFSLGLFFAGAWLAYRFVIGLVLDYLLAFNADLGIDPDPRISEWLSFVLLLPVGFGVSFQLPLVMLFVDRFGILSAETMLSKWRIAVMAIAVLSAILTPADPGSMVLMAAPLTLLFFGGILLCRLLPRRKSPFGEPVGG